MSYVCSVHNYVSCCQCFVWVNNSVLYLSSVSFSLQVFFFLPSKCVIKCLNNFIFSMHILYLSCEDQQLFGAFFHFLSVFFFVTVCFNYFKKICLHNNIWKSFGVHRRFSLPKMMPIIDLNTALFKIILNDPSFFLSFYFRFLYLSVPFSLSSWENSKGSKGSRWSYIWHWPMTFPL